MTSFHRFWLFLDNSSFGAIFSSLSILDDLPHAFDSRSCGRFRIKPASYLSFRDKKLFSQITAEITQSMSLPFDHLSFVLILTGPNPLDPAVFVGIVSFL
jgi:hypothetical protein